jgi:two-component system sensor histidine kinase TtrS
MVNIKYCDEYVMLTVIDNGVGFEQQPDEIIDQAFYTTKEEGLGLGLAICRQVVESHHGSIKFDPVEPRGCKVVVTLPYLEDNYA